MAEFKKLSAVEMVQNVDQTTTVLIEKDGVIKRAPKNKIGAQADWTETNESSSAFIKNKPHKELIYEWNFSTDDEVYEIYENIDEDMSWLTKYQDDIGFEIIVENYGYQYDYNNTNNDHNYVYLNNCFAAVSSADCPYFSRCVNIPVDYDGQQFTHKETLLGWIKGHEIQNEYQIDDTTKRCFRLYPSCRFNIENGVHYDFNTFLPTSVQNGGAIVFESNDNPFKSVKIYKVIR